MSVGATVWLLLGDLCDPSLGTRSFSVPCWGRTAYIGQHFLIIQLNEWSVAGVVDDQRFYCRILLLTSFQFFRSGIYFSV